MFVLILLFSYYFHFFLSGAYLINRKLMLAIHEQAMEEQYNLAKVQQKLNLIQQRQEAFGRSNANITEHYISKIFLLMSVVFIKFWRKSNLFLGINSSTYSITYSCYPLWRSIKQQPGFSNQLCCVLLFSSCFQMLFVLSMFASKSRGNNVFFGLSLFLSLSRFQVRTCLLMQSYDFHNVCSTHLQKLVCSLL